jgi:23S rRNA pseudouridine1911/1915/1917 synthase
MDWTVTPGEQGTRLDRFLAAHGRLGSRGGAAAALERGKVFLNGDEATPAQAGSLLTAGDRVRVWTDRPGSATRRHRTRRPRADPGLDIVFEDSVLLVVNKPPGLLTVRLPRRPEAPSVESHLANYLRPQRRMPHVVHRIDRDTSGVVVFAKHARGAEALKAQFLRREPARVYLAVVEGHPSPPQGTWRDHLVWDRAVLTQRSTSARTVRAHHAISHYRVVDILPGASLLEVRLDTGKRNQIRIQAALRGHPLIGERQYRDSPGKARPVEPMIRFGRQALHAWRIRLAHPIDGRPVAFEAALPSDMRELLTRLRRMHQESSGSSV